MPDLSKPPLHTLPREDLIAKLKSAYLTGFRSEVGEVPGTVGFSTRGARSRTRKYAEHPEARKRHWRRCIADRSRKLVRYAGSTLTNLRVARDPDSPTGWKLTHDPFPGWETVPSW